MLRLDNNKVIFTPGNNINNFTSRNVLKSSPLAHDIIQFSGKANLFKKYNINPNEVEVVSNNSARIDTKTKEMLIQKVLEAYEHALKNEALGNYSGRFFSFIAMFENGKWGPPTANIENSTDNAFCAERSAIVATWNKFLENLSPVRLKNNSNYKQKAIESMKVKYLVRCSSLGPKQGQEGTPCCDCLNWFNYDRFFNPHTEFANLSFDCTKNKYLLEIKKLDELLPYWGKHAPSLSEQDVFSLPLEITPKAQNYIQQNNISEQTLQNMVQKAKETYTQSQTSELSDKNLACSVLLAPGNLIIADDRMDWTRRWFTPPDLLAASNGFKFIKKCQDYIKAGKNIDKLIPEDLTIDKEALVKNIDETPKIHAIAYYGDDKVPYLEGLGRISQDRGSANTLVLVVQDNKIKIDTILGYMPFLYISSKKKC